MRSQPTWQWFRLAGWKVQRLVEMGWLAEGLTWLGGAWYLAQAWIYVHTQASLLDEGAYLVKGILYATGRYRLYQDFGPWANHMPLAFLIPGYVQSVFGPGLRTGRYLALFFAVFMLIGLVVLARRYGNRWWAAGAVWAVALNPALVKIYSLAVTQSMMSALLIWMLVAALGAGRRTWQLVIAAILAGLMLMTRLNFFPVLPLLLLYILWEHGWRKALWPALAGGLLVLLGHLIFWPGILRLWAAWLPTELAPFLAPFRPPAATPYWAPNPGFESRLLSFFLGIRYHFLACLGALTTVLLWPRQIDRQYLERVRVCLLTGSLFVVFFVFHAWASLGEHGQTDMAYGKDYCIFCFPMYLGFFSNLGLVMFIAGFPLLQRNLGRWRQLLIALLLFGLAGGSGYRISPGLGAALLPLFDLRVPRMRDFRFLPGTTTLRGMLETRLGLTSVAFERLALQTVPVLAGILLVGILLVVAAWLARAQANLSRPISAGFIALVLFGISGALLTPSEILGGGYHTYDCSGDVIASYEAVGQKLAGIIPPDAQVYWRGGDSAVPLLYLPGRGVFPPQINGDYSFRLDGDPQAVARYGYWNDALAQGWARQADYLLVSEEYFVGWLRELLESGEYDEKMPTEPAAACRSETVIHIYVRNP
jgi:hypothetical protein